MNPYTKIRSRSVAAIGEERLIALIRGWLGPASPRTPFGIGDDCAVLPGARGRQLITVDPLIHGRHFDNTVPARAAGAKLLARNLSDLAAMGGRPTAAVLALTLDERVSVAWLELFYRGLAAAARRYKVPIVGGDIAQADGVVAASLTLLGKATGTRVLTRTGARTGDWIFVTGRLGRSRVTGHHFRFMPRLDEGAWLARRPEVRSMMDLSDGLAKDIHALTPRGAVPAISAADLPRNPGAGIAEAVADGEDYELLFALGAGTDLAAFHRDWSRRFPKTLLSCIGQFVGPHQSPQNALNLAAYRGYEHLVGPRPGIKRQGTGKSAPSPVA